VVTKNVGIVNHFAVGLMIELFRILMLSALVFLALTFGLQITLDSLASFDLLKLGVLGVVGIVVMLIEAIATGWLVIMVASKFGPVINWKKIGVGEYFLAGVAYHIIDLAIITAMAAVGLIAVIKVLIAVIFSGATLTLPAVGIGVALASVVYLISIFFKGWIANMLASGMSR